MCTKTLSGLNNIWTARLVFTKLSIQESSDSAQIFPNMFHDIWINVHKPTSTHYSPLSLKSTQHQKNRKSSEMA